MSLIDVFLIGVAIVSFLLTFLVLLRNPKNIINISFSLFILNATIWPLAIAFFRITQNLNTALFWDRIIYLSGTIVPISFLFFAEVFTKKKSPPLSHVAVYLLSPLIFLLFLFFSDLWIQQIIIETSGKSVLLGPVYLLWMAYFGVFMSWGVYLLWQKYKKAVGFEKAQIRYILFAVLFPLLGAFPFNFLLPLFGNYDLIFIGPFFLTAMIIVISYAIVRHRLFDLSFAMQKLITYLTATLITTIVLIISAVGYALYANETLSLDVFALTIIVAAILVLVFGKIQSLSHAIAGKYFFQAVYDYRKTLRDLSANLSSYLEMPRLVDTITTTLKDTMKLSSIAVLVRDFDNDHYKIQKSLGFNRENGLALVRDNFLTNYLEKHPQIIVLDEVKRIAEETPRKVEQEGLNQLSKHMEKIEAELVMPIVNAGKLISLIVLGSKASHDPYTVQDIHLLDTISSQASIALENARLYKEVQILNEGLEEKVEEATKKLQERNKMLEEANIKIGLADKVKNDLLTMASHEFRTPTSIINNALYFLNTKDVKKKLSNKEKQNLDRIVNTMDRLNYVVTNINQMLVTTSGELELEVTPTQVEILLKEVLEDKHVEAKEKQIEIKYDEPKKLLPEIVADRVKLKYVLWELITNALKYTDKGGEIKIKAKAGKKNIQITIADNGVGIPKEALPNLFQGFGKIDVFHKTQSGMGLGLYVVKQIIDLHDGEIEINSKKDKGTTVEITLPVKPLSKIKLQKKEAETKTPKEEESKDKPENYDKADDKKLPHHLNVVKCLAAFQLVAHYLFFRRLA